MSTEEPQPDLPPAPIQPFPPEQIAQLARAWPAEWNEYSLSALNLTHADIPRFMATILALGHTVTQVPQLIDERARAYDVIAMLIKEKGGTTRVYKRVLDSMPEKWEIEFTPLGDCMRLRLVEVKEKPCTEAK